MHGAWSGYRRQGKEGRVKEAGGRWQGVRRQGKGGRCKRQGEDDRV
jgi:hypothetical protein